MFAALLPWLSSCADTSSAGASEVWTADAEGAPETTDTPGGARVAPRRETRPVFDLDADLTASATFFDQPWPSDSRLLDGRPDLRGLPLPDAPDLGRAFRDRAVETRGASQHPVGWFRTTAPLASIAPDVAVAADTSAPILLIDVDADSPERGGLVPIVAETLHADSYTPLNLLGISPRPGFVLAPNTRYAYVVRRTVLDAAGEPLAPAGAVASLLKGDVPPGGEALAPLFASLAETLTTLAIPLDDVATATVFTTGDPASELRSLTDAIIGDNDVAMVAFGTTPGGGKHDRFCALDVRVVFPQFQSGLPPFDTDGLIDTTSADFPTPLREEIAPAVLTLPRSPMPTNGYPVVLYLHGPDGRSSDVVDRGPIDEESGAPKKGQGPGWVLAPHGFATLGIALPMNRQRLPGIAPGALLGTVNPSAIRDHLRQAVIEARLLIEATQRLTIPPFVVAGCGGVSEELLTSRLDPNGIYVMGDRVGGMIATLLAAVDPSVNALVTGNAGGDLVALLSASDSPSADRRLDPARWGLAGPIGPRHPAHHIAQLALGPADPALFVSRIGHRPHLGWPPHSLLQAVGNHDKLIPTSILDVMAVAAAHPQVGTSVWTSMLEALAWAPLEPSSPYPVAANLTTIDGWPYTSAVVQVDAAGKDGQALPDAGAILTQVDSLKFQYACFFRSHRETGVAAIVAPQPLGEACPELPQ
ncbi:MAG: hypothetical protein IV100_12125 [Myxococcales bacterium]|nr:hypothetical protein [Myxococcales bacterium]